MPKVTAELSASELPPRLARQLPGGRAVPGALYRVTVEEVGEEAKRGALIADLQAARDELAAGFGLDADEVFSQLESDDRVEDR